MSHELRFQPAPSELRRVRSEVRDAAAKLGAPERICDTAALVVDELVNNAIEHGAVYRQHGHELGVRLAKLDGGFELVFHDPEMPEDEVSELARALGNANEAPSLENERGRGLFLLSVYLDQLQVGVDPDQGGLSLRGVITNG
ncbi:MAG: ATP-binding protein [Planctomycetes bacterium]|nr:ATP-binding protein [Planctomycetota bacterium]